MRAVSTPILASAQTTSKSMTQLWLNPGNTLSKINGAVLQPMEKIYEANKDLLKNSNYIYIGTKLTIPGEDEAS